MPLTEDQKLFAALGIGLFGGWIARKIYETPDPPSTHQCAVLQLPDFIKHCETLSNTYQSDACGRAIQKCIESMQVPKN